MRKIAIALVLAAIFGVGACTTKAGSCRQVTGDGICLDNLQSPDNAAGQYPIDAKTRAVMRPPAIVG